MMDRGFNWLKFIAVYLSIVGGIMLLLGEWYFFNPPNQQTPLQKAKDSFVSNCGSQYGTPNVGSDNPKNWTCQK